MTVMFPIAMTKREKAEDRMPIRRADRMRAPLAALARALSATEVARASLAAMMGTGRATRGDLRVGVARLDSAMGEVGTAMQDARRAGIIVFESTWSRVGE